MNTRQHQIASLTEDIILAFRIAPIYLFFFFNKKLVARNLALMIDLTSKLFILDSKALERIPNQKLDALPFFWKKVTPEKIVRACLIQARRR